MGSITPFSGHFPSKSYQIPVESPRFYIICRYDLYIFVLGYISYKASQNLEEIISEETELTEEDITSNPDSET